MNDYVNVISPSGELGNLPANALQEAFKYGYRPATSHEVQQDFLRERYGEGFGNELTSAVEGAASGATFGLSRHLENLSGITTPFAQAARKEFNPLSSGLGEAAGIAGSLLLAPEVSLPGLVGRGAGTAGRVAAEILGEGAIQRVAAKTIAGGLEGMAYGAGSPISESALGDPTITAQKVFSQIGIGGLFGGGIGAVAGSLGLLKPRFLQQTLEAGEPTAQPVQGIVEDIDRKLASDFPGSTPEEINKVRSNPTEFFNTPTINPDPNFVAPNGARPEKATKVFLDDLDKLDNTLEQRELTAQDMIESSGIKISKGELKGLLQKQIDAIAPEGAMVPAEEDAIDLLQKHIDLLDNNKATEMSGTDLRSYIQRIRKGIKKYQSQRMPGTPSSFEETELESAIHNINEMLRNKVEKAGVEGFGDLMDQYSKEMNVKKTLVKQLRLDSEGNSMLGTDAFRNRVITPLQKMVQGTGSGKDTIWSKMMTDLGEVTGTDWRNIAENNLIFSKLYPELASEAQKGPWATQVLGTGQKIAEAVRHPGKALLNMAGDIVEHMTPGSDLRQQMARDALLTGRASSFGIVDSILSKVKGGIQSGSKLFDQSSPFGSLLVPAGVKLQQYVSGHDTLENADRQLETLMALEKARNKTNKAIDSSVSGIFSDQKPSEDLPIKDFMGKSPKEHAEGFEHFSQDINQLVNDPNLLTQQLTQAMKGIAKHAPNVATGLNMTAVRALNMLSQKLASISPKNPSLPLDQKFVPSRSQLLSVAKTLKYINSPYDVLKEIQTGMVSNEGKEVLQKIYPELYQELKGKVMNGISIMQSSGKHIPTSKRGGLSFFLGTQLDSTLRQPSIAANQMTFHAPMPTQNAPNPSATSMGNLTLSSRYMTSTQKIASK